MYTRPTDVPSSITYKANFGDDPAVSENTSLGLFHQQIDNGNSITEIWRDQSPLNGGNRFANVEVTYTAP